MTKKNLIFFIIFVVLVGLITLIVATRPGVKPGESKLETFVVQKPYLIATGKALSKVDIIAVPTGTGITEADYQILGSAQLQGEQDGTQLWRLAIPNDPVLATEIFAQGYATNGTKTNKISLPITGATEIYNTLWSTSQSSVSGTIKSVGASAKTILVTTSAGTNVMVAIDKDTLITTLTTGADATFTDLKVGRTVVAEGTTFSDGSMKASQIRVGLGSSVSVDVKITSPVSGALVSSPLTVTGQARGNWFFEANIPVKLLDANRKVIAQIGGQAQGEWMTTDFVPFTATLTFTKPTTKTGFLVISNDNPSGLPENDKSIEFPVTF